MKLYWGSHTCAIGIHVLLEEIGAPYETEKLDVADGATRRMSKGPFTGRASRAFSRPRCSSRQDLVHQTVGLGKAHIWGEA